MYRRDSLDSELVDAVPAYPSKDGCISRVPYASVMAFVMCLIGVILFGTMMIWSFNASIEQARRALDIDDIPWLEKVHLSFIIISVLMAIFSLFLLLIGVLSTGSTREEVYKRKDSRRGGRIICALAILVSYILNILWIFIVAITAILSFVYYIFSRLCQSLDSNDHGCLDFNVFQPLVASYSNADLKLCSGQVQEFCALTNTVFSWNIVGFVGAMIIVIGLVAFVASNASNYAHVNNEQRYIELKEVLYMEGIVPPPLPPPFQPPVRAYPPSPPAIPPPSRTRKHRGYDCRDDQGPPPPSRRRDHHERERSLPRSMNPGMGSVRRNSYQNSLHGSTPWLNNQY